MKNSVRLAIIVFQGMGCISLALVLWYFIGRIALAIGYVIDPSVYKIVQLIIPFPIYGFFADRIAKQNNSATK